MTPEFRVWDKNTERMWDIETWHFEDEYLDLIEPGVSICDPCIERIWRKQGDVELMQYTGLKDANGNKIFEGDILKSSQGHTQPFYYLVKYSEQHAAFVVDGLFLGGVSGLDLQPYEVAGNIHEDGDLIDN